MGKICLLGAIGYDDIGDDALLLCNVESFVKLGYKIVIFTNSIHKTADLLIKNGILPTNGISDDIKIVESLGSYIESPFNFLRSVGSFIGIPSNPFVYIDLVSDEILYRVFKKKMNFFMTIYCVILYYKLVLNLKGYFPINQRLRAYLENIKECSSLLFIGGGYMNKYWGARIYQFIISFIIGKKLSSTTIASGQTFGPLNTLQKYIFKKHIQELDYICVRDVERSKQRLVELGYDENKIVEGPDDAIFLSSSKTTLSTQYTKDFVIIANFGGSFMYSKSSSGYIYSTIAQFFDEIIKSKNGIILYVSMDVGGADYSRGMEIQSNMKFKDGFHFLPLYTGVKKIKSIIRDSNLVVSNRLHPVVFAISEKKPFIGISSGGEYYDSKLKGISEIYGYNPKNHIINVDDLDVDTLHEYCTRALKDNYRNENIYELNERKRKDFFRYVEKMINLQSGRF